MPGLQCRLHTQQCWVVNKIGNSQVRLSVRHECMHCALYSIHCMAYSHPPLLCDACGPLPSLFKSKRLTMPCAIPTLAFHLLSLTGVPSKDLQSHFKFRIDNCVCLLKINRPLYWLDQRLANPDWHSSSCRFEFESESGVKLRASLPGRRIADCRAMPSFRPFGGENCFDNSGGHN